MSALRPNLEEIVVEADGERLARRAAEWLVQRMAAVQGPFRIALSGGSTPRRLYGLLADEPFRSRVAWDRLELFWGDERFVPHDDKDSNYRMVRDTLLMGGPVPRENIHPIPTDGDPRDAAIRYEAELQRVYGTDRLEADRTLFDVVLLGLGDDGHIASLLPGQPAMEERERWVVPVAKGRPEVRITLTLPALESSTAIAFLVTGASKAQVVRQARTPGAEIPAARLRPRHELRWFLDRDAARELET